MICYTAGLPLISSFMFLVHLCMFSLSIVLLFSARMENEVEIMLFFVPNHNPVAKPRPNPNPNWPTDGK